MATAFGPFAFGSALADNRVLVLVGGRTEAEEHELLSAGVPGLVFAARRDQDGVSPRDRTRLSRDEHRILLTRDRRLLMRSAVEHGHWVRTPEPREQLSEVIRRYNLLPLFRPYTRCARCNGLLEPVSREEVAQLLQPRTAQLHTEFTRCQQCGQVYWPGSHLRRLREILNTVQEGLLDEEQHPKAKKREELG